MTLQDKRLLEGAMMHAVLMRNIEAFKAVTNYTVALETHLLNVCGTLWKLCLREKSRVADERGSNPKP